MENKERYSQQCFLYECDECNFKNRFPIIWKYHMKCHKRNHRIKCPLCSFSAESKFYVARHLKLHHLNLGDAKQSPEYLQEMDYVIRTLLDINENLLENVDGNNNPLSNSELENEEMGQPEESKRSGFAYKCRVCNYRTDNPANGELHEIAHQGNDYEFRCTLCNYSSNLKFVVIRHMNRDHQYPTVSNYNQTNFNVESRLKTYLQAKEMDTDKAKFELANPNNIDENDKPKVNVAEVNILQKQQPNKLEGLKVKIIEAEFRKRISQRKEEIRLARISMAETRDKIKQLKEIRSEKKKEKEILYHQS